MFLKQTKNINKTSIFECKPNFKDRKRIFDPEHNSANLLFQLPHASALHCILVSLISPADQHSIGFIILRASYYVSFYRRQRAPRGQSRAEYPYNGLAGRLICFNRRSQICNLHLATVVVSVFVSECVLFYDVVQSFRRRLRVCVARSDYIQLGQSANTFRDDPCGVAAMRGTKLDILLVRWSVCSVCVFFCLFSFFCLLLSVALTPPPKDETKVRRSEMLESGAGWLN